MKYVRSIITLPIMILFYRCSTGDICMGDLFLRIQAFYTLNLKRKVRKLVPFYLDYFSSDHLSPMIISL